MSSILSPYKKFIALLMSFFSLFAALGPVTFSPVDANNIKLNFSVISDTHINNDIISAPKQTLVKGLKDITKAEIKSDALVISGDMTETGTENEYYKLGNALKYYSKTDNYQLEMGNHDIRGETKNGVSLLTYEENVAKYYDFLKDTAGIIESTVYYHRIIKDCYFIVMNSEAIESLQTYISDAQIQWIDGLLAAASASGNPVFIVNHQPLWYLGDESVALNSVLQKYNGLLDIFFISGHYHHGFSESSISSNGTIYFVDMPSFGKTPGSGYQNVGSGFQVELYANQIFFRARDFAKGEWLSEYDRTIDLIVR